MQKKNILIDALENFDPKNWSTAYTFYLDALDAAGYSRSGITLQAATEENAELTSLMNAIETAPTETLKRVSTGAALSSYPYNSKILYRLGSYSSSTSMALACALAIRQLHESIPMTEEGLEADERADIIIGLGGVDMLFEMLILNELDVHFMPTVLHTGMLSIRTAQGVLNEAMRTAAIFDVRRNSTIVPGKLYANIREFYVGDGAYGDVVDGIALLCDIIQESSINGPSARLHSLNTAFQSVPVNDDIAFFMERVSEYISDLDEILQLTTKPPSTLPIGNVMKDFHRLMDREQFGTVEEVEAFMEKYKHEPIPELDSNTLNDSERAEDLVEEYSMLELPEARRRLTELSRTYPIVMWPWLGLADASATAEDKLKYADAGLAVAGLYATAEFFDMANGNAWGIHGARPYLRLLAIRTSALARLGRTEEAIAVAEHIQRLERQDYHGTKELLLALYLRRGMRDHLDKAETMIAVMHTDDAEYQTLPWLWLLLVMVRKRSQAVIQEALDNAMNDFPWVGLLLTEVPPISLTRIIPPLRKELENDVVAGLIISEIAWSGYSDEFVRLRKMIRRM
ncbi:hypothetical protein BH10BAC6_BH10BAC6_12770 [soil metagenome]